MDFGVWGIATPIFDRNRNVAAAIGIVGPSSRFSAALAAQDLAWRQQTAQRLMVLLSAGSQP
jgi:DNA-binding IclR family transcriptional regulator